MMGQKEQISLASEDEPPELLCEWVEQILPKFEGMDPERVDKFLRMLEESPQPYLCLLAENWESGWVSATPVPEDVITEGDFMANPDRGIPITVRNIPVVPVNNRDLVAV
jgi:hypothetical protein